MGKFEVERSVLIDVPVEQVFAQVRDFQTWPIWSPWLCAEPACSVEFSADGSEYKWQGEVVGEGSMKVIGELRNQSIDYELEIIKPWKSTSRVSFFFRPEGDRTRTAWQMTGNVPFYLFWTQSSMEMAIGMDYKRGLMMLKDYVEKGAIPSQIEFLGEQSFDGFSYVGLRTNCRIMDVGEKMEADLQKVMKWVEDQHVKPTGRAFSIYHKWSIGRGSTCYTIGLPVEKIPGWLPEGFVSGNIPAGEVNQIRHIGPYRHLGNAWAAGIAHVRAKKWSSSKIRPFEVYENDPSEVGSEEVVTTLHFPIKS